MYKLIFMLSAHILNLQVSEFVLDLVFVISFLFLIRSARFICFSYLYLMYNSIFIVTFRFISRINDKKFHSSEFNLLLWYTMDKDPRKNICRNYYSDIMGVVLNFEDPASVNT
ncbi:hypothetical protein Leryth_014911 [Lithospermum erythrorhizon]|nr:hypothetical protein Leryth_014911 [Lithospermum erythrorhizon]